MRAIDFSEKKTAEFVQQHDREYYCSEDRRYSEEDLGTGEYLCFRAARGFFLTESEPSTDDQRGERPIRWVKIS